MGLKGVKCSKGLIPMDEHKTCMLDPMHPCHLTEDVLEMVTGGNREREEHHVVYSPSSLLGCGRQDSLKTSHDWFLDVETAWPAQRGNFVHALMEGRKSWDGIIGVVRELRMSTEVLTKHGPESFKGKADLIQLVRLEKVGEKNILHVRVVDYKTKTEIGHGPVTHKDDPSLAEDEASADVDHLMQINMYAFLVRHALGPWLNMRLDPNQESFPGWNEYRAHMHLNQSIDVYIHEVVVDGIEIFYADMKKTRRIISEGTLVAKGKRLSMAPLTYQELKLRPLTLFEDERVEAWIIRRIEMKKRMEGKIPPPLDEKAAKKRCYYCPVKRVCLDVGYAQGLDMSAQEKN